MASSSLSFRFERASSADTADGGYKLSFECNESVFYNRMQRYPLPCLPSSPLFSFSHMSFLASLVMSFPRMTSVLHPGTTSHHGDVTGWRTVCPEVVKIKIFKVSEFKNLLWQYVNIYLNYHMEKYFFKYLYYFL